MPAWNPWRFRGLRCWSRGSGRTLQGVQAKDAAAATGPGTVGLRLPVTSQKTSPLPKFITLLPLTTHSLRVFSNTRLVKNETLYGLADGAPEPSRVRRTGKPKFHPTGDLSSRPGGMTGMRSPRSPRGCSLVAAGWPAGELRPQQVPGGCGKSAASSGLLPGGQGRGRGCSGAPRRAGLTGPPLRQARPRSRRGRQGPRAPGRPDAGGESAAGGRSAGTLRLWSAASLAHPSLPRPPPGRACP